jgi:uncharacterized protein (DUF433 family)
MSHYMDYIAIDSAVMMGKPVIAGTRMTVEQILEEMSAGKLPQDLLAAHPSLSEAAIRAALAFSADALRGERSYPVAS